MKTLLWFLVVLALPVAAYGNSVDLSNNGGTLSGSNSGLSLTGSTLVGFNAGSLITGNLGSLTLLTGALTSGDLQNGGTFAAGGTFVVTGNGTSGVPNGTIFSGTFSTPATWNLVTLANGTHNYTLVGTLSGTWYTGATVEGTTIQLTLNTGKGFFNGTTTISSGDTNIGLPMATSPEPSSMILMGSGLLGLTTTLLRRRKVQRQSNAG
jgi:hypothetical protein